MIRRRLLTRLGLVLVVALALTLPWRLAAQTPAELTRELDVLSGWVEEAQSASLTFLDIIEQGSEIDALAYGVLAGEIAPERARRTGAETIGVMRLRFEEAAQHMDAELEPPSLHEEKLAQTVRNSVRYLRMVRNQAERMIETSESALAAALDDDIQAYTILERKNRDNAILMIESENVAIGMQMALLDKTVPQLELFRSYYFLNEAIIAVYRMMGETGREEAAPSDMALDSANTFVGSAATAVENGRTLVGAQRDEAASDSELSEGHVKWFLGIMDNYANSFDVEERLVDVVSGLVDASAQSAAADLKQQLRENFVEVGALIERRVALTKARVQLIGRLRKLR
jgi:hypothetical protein